MCNPYSKMPHLSTSLVQNNALSISYTQFDFLNSFSLKLVSQNKEKLSGVTFLNLIVWNWFYKVTD